jgi:PHD/YefM family antitoxin component YafN of YafNO toxin-antitoxin module
MVEFMTATNARKNLYKIIEDCHKKGDSFVLTSKGKAVRVIDERSFQEIVLSRRLEQHPETIGTIDRAKKELKKKQSRKNRPIATSRV